MRPGDAQRRDVSSPVWAVTSYFNPVGYRSRRENYRVFRRHLELPLLTVEWSPTGRFELGPGDAEVLVQLDGGDVMWQKERLLNIGIGRLPEHCTHVAWLDCDIVFERRGLADAIVQALERDRLVQLYDRVAHLGPPQVGEDDPARSEVLFEREGVVAAVARAGASAISVALAAGDGAASRGKPCPGFAWAAERALLSRHPLFECWVAGGGDSAFCHAAADRLDYILDRDLLSIAHREDFVRRGGALARAVDGRLGHLSGRMFALWHGRFEDRRYATRHTMLAGRGFDPLRFLRAAPSGVWAWGEVPADLPREMLAYFTHRNEDGAPAAAESRDG